jgi:hypothetical protein
MGRDLLLSERRHARLHHPGQISFTATKADFDAAGVKVIGVSADDVASHKNFCNKFAFTIDLLSDTDSSLMKALGIGQAEWKGMKFWERTSFVIDPKGVIRKVYEKVNPEGHERVLLDDIEGIKRSDGSRGRDAQAASLRLGCPLFRERIRGELRALAPGPAHHSGQPLGHYRRQNPV